MLGQQVRQKANRQDVDLAYQLVENAALASLAVVSSDGAPIVALTSPVLLPNGALLVLVSSLSAHGKALSANSQAGILFTGVEDLTDPMKTPRLTVQGNAVKATVDERAFFLKSRPEAELYIDFSDMRLYRIDLKNAHLVVGFGRAVSLSPGCLARRL
jgi:putative heme iron utilization protein